MSILRLKWYSDGFFCSINNLLNHIRILSPKVCIVKMWIKNCKVHGPYPHYHHYHHPLIQEMNQLMKKLLPGPQKSRIKSWKHQLLHNTPSSIKMSNQLQQSRIIYSIWKLTWTLYSLLPYMYTTNNITDNIISEVTCKVERWRSTISTLT